MSLICFDDSLCASLADFPLLKNLINLSTYYVMRLNLGLYRFGFGFGFQNIIKDIYEIVIDFQYMCDSQVWIRK